MRLMFLVSNIKPDALSCSASFVVNPKGSCAGSDSILTLPSRHASSVSIELSIKNLHRAPSCLINLADTISCSIKRCMTRCACCVPMLNLLQMSDIFLGTPQYVAIAFLSSVETLGIYYFLPS
jgi:hypothetical protein